MHHSDSPQYILGIDVGANSLGWAAIALSDGNPSGILATGVRVFEAGVEGDIESGKDQSRAAKRREARLRRRMLERRARRLRKLATLLQGAALLPPGDMKDDAARHDLFLDLDRTLYARHFPAGAKVGPAAAHVLPYRLRARALDETLQPYELGRSLYHLAQRRGFLSNRKTAAKSDDEKKGKVKGDISELSKQMQDTEARTLGEYFSRLDPQEEERRIRNRYTSRQMYEDEFGKIWQAQVPHHPAILTEELRKRVRRAIFFQRPLKIDRNLIGDCELERGRKCAPLAILAAQRFRLLQEVNNLRLIEPTGELRALREDERRTLADELESHGELSFARVRRLLKLSKDCRFKFEEGGEEKLLGNRTAAKLSAVFGERWAQLSPADRDRVVEDWRSIQKNDTLYRRALKEWKLSEEQARQFAELKLEPGHCRLSRQALAKVLPLLEQGVAYATARKQLYGEQPPPQPLPLLPPIDRAPIPQLRNPAVHRALTELRKVVNGLIARHGTPHLIRIELARDLKKTRKDRQAIAKQNLQNRRGRERAIEELLKQAGIQQPRGADIEKWLLAEECGWHCPYTGKEINAATLSQFDVEHIIPLGRCMDNSFMNKTLCENEENRNRKRNRTPWEAYGSDPKRWEEILRRVDAFKSNAARAKLQRFQLSSLESLEDFTARQLNDTRYASRLAGRYVGLLYGCSEQGVDPDGTRRIQLGRGMTTALLRNAWQLGRILKDGGEKSRDDHRHHAIDAIVTALTDTRTIKMFSEASSRAAIQWRRLSDTIELPWPGFFEQVQGAVDSIVVSHRVSRKVSGPLHEDTIYSKPQKDPDGRDCVHVRKRVDALSKGDVEHIVDPAIRQLVTKKLAGEEASKVFADPKHHPRVLSGSGREIPIHSVRIRKYETTMSLGAGPTERRVMTGSNHHVEIVEVADNKGRPKWEGVVVSLYEAMKRLRNRQPIVQRDHGEGRKWVFSLSGGEVIQLDTLSGPRLYVVRTISKSRQKQREYVNIEFVTIEDARRKDEIKKAKAWRSALIEPLRQLHCRKMAITPLGEVRYAND